MSAWPRALSLRIQRKRKLQGSCDSIEFIKDLVQELNIMTERDPQENKIKSKVLLKDLNKSSALRLFEAFFEAAPQLVLQLYIIYSNAGRQGHMGAVQWCSVCISLASLSLPVTTFYKMRRLGDGKYKVSVPDTALLIAFLIFTVGARVLSLAILSVSSGYSLLGVTLIHCGIMFVWILLMENSNICDVDCDKFADNFGFAFIYIFCFIDYYMDGYSRLRYAFFYTLTYIENIGILFFWYFYSPPSYDWQRYLACTSIIEGYFIGILCSVVYYVDFHPNNLINDPKKEIKVLVPLTSVN